MHASRSSSGYGRSEDVSRNPRLSRVAAGRHRPLVALYVGLALAVGVAALGTPPRARAAVVATDSFAYPDGPLFGRNGGSGWTTGWAGFLTNVVSEEAVGNSETQFTGTRNFDNPGTTPELFVAFTVRVPATLASDDFIGVHLNAGANSSNLTVGKVPGTSVFIVGNGGWVESSIPVQPGVTYRVIGVYDLDQSRTSLWVDPDASDYYEPTTGSSSADASGIFSLHAHMHWIAFQGSVGGMGFDDIVISNTPEGVGLAASPPSSVEDIATGSAGDSGGQVSVSPNPCRDALRIAFTAPQAGPALLEVHDVHGRRLEVLDLGMRAAGSSTVELNVASRTAGVYFYRIRRTGAADLRGRFTVER